MTKSAILSTSTPKVDAVNRSGTSVRNLDASLRKTLNLNSFETPVKNGDDKLDSDDLNNTRKENTMPTMNSMKANYANENNSVNEDGAKGASRNYSNQNGTTESGDILSSSMIAKNKINTEEEAKAALAERRRIAREEAERLAEIERKRVEMEQLAELKRMEEEAEQQRKFEEEAIRLAEEQRKAEEERLRQAIEVCFVKCLKRNSKAYYIFEIYVGDKIARRRGTSSS